MLWVRVDDIHGSLIGSEAWQDVSDPHRKHAIALVSWSFRELFFG